MKQRFIFLFVSCSMFLTLAHGQTGNFIPSDRFSSSLISELCQDQLGYIWIGTDYGLNRFDGYDFQTFLHDETDSTSLQTNVVSSLLCDHEGSLWVGTNRGLDRFDPVKQTFTHYRFPDSRQPRITTMLQLHDGKLLVGTAGYGAYLLDKDDVLRNYDAADNEAYFSNVFEDSKGRLWRSGFNDVISLYTGTTSERFSSSVGNPVGFVELGGEILIVCQHGILSYREGSMSEADIDMSILTGKDVNFSSLTTDESGSIYIGSRGRGMFRLSVQQQGEQRKLEAIEIDAAGIDLSTAKIRATLYDRRGNLWLGCDRKGLLLVPQRPVQFNSWSFERQGIRLGATISSVCEGDNGIVWCTMQGVGVYGFDERGHVVAHPSAPAGTELIFRDRLRRYWIGTDAGLYAYDPLTGRSELKVTRDCEKFNYMTSDFVGRIFISTFAQGFCVYDPRTGNQLNHSFYDTDTIRGRLCNNWIMGMAADREGLIWMATASGVACYNPHNDSFNSQGWTSLLNGIVCFDVCELRSGQLEDGRRLSDCIAIGTEQGLYLYDRQTHQVDRFPGSEQLTNKVVCYIVQSNDGDLWCSTSQGIWQYSLKGHSFIGHVGGNGLTQKEYIYGVGMHTSADMIYFGQNDGLTVFSPKDVKESTPSLDSLLMTSFRAGNEYVTAGTVLNGVQVTDKGVSESDHFTLSYLDHTVTLAFSQFNFDNLANVSFEYRVNGGQWISTPEGTNDFTLGHLTPGTYHIEVRAKQAGEYSPVKEVEVTIRAPWYRTTLAYLIYLLLLAGLLFFIQRAYRRKAAEQLNEEKMKFLINATHDIRSPLTLIMAALKKLKSDSSGAVNTIESNSKRILDLVNQILDVRKIDKQQMRLHCQKTDLVAFTQGVCKMFEYNAQERNINFQFQHDSLDHLDAWIDRTQFDKVITNLLSNAFKYSYDGGEVKVVLKSASPERDTTAPTGKSKEASRATGGTFLTLQVIDDGVGLEGDSLKHIFERFYQGSNARRLNIDGTGIGLNLCKMIVDMHHGTIEASNRTDSQRGSVFTVTLPLGNSHLKPDEIDQAAVPSTPVKASMSTNTSSRRRVLIVDDDLEIGRYVSNELGRYYKFGICPNGKEGLKELLTNDYDVVVSDVMMPEMDGFTMLRMIKTNLNLSHLPVIMLTSKADVANRLEGLERGADAFLAKPFDMEELHLTIENLIHGRQHLRGKFSGAQQQTDRLQMPEVKGNDEHLMERIMKVVNKNLSDSDFNVDMLTREVGISRTQLHRKMKELTGLSTSEFIRNIRLEQAARLLKEQKINITQVAYTVGFSNLAHFSTIFRRHFGISPSEYVNQ